LLNDPTFSEAARALAIRALDAGGQSTQERIDFLYRRVVSRHPSELEINELMQLLSSSRQFYDGHPQEAEKLLTIGQKPAPTQSNSAEAAAWTIVARSVLNLYEAITRN
jgi:hypothetical protein